MYYLYDCEWHKGGNLDEISWDFMNDILKYEAWKLLELFEMTILNGIYGNKPIYEITIVNQIVYNSYYTGILWTTAVS